MSATKGFSRAVVIGLLLVGGAASAQAPRRAPAAQTRSTPKAPVAKAPVKAPVAKDAKAPTTKGNTPAKAPVAKAPVAPVVASATAPIAATGPVAAPIAHEASESTATMHVDAAEPTAEVTEIYVEEPVRAPIPATMLAPSANAVMTSYQRVGRDIIQLQNLRGTECTLELWKTFRTIKLDEATATKESRIATAATLQELQAKIARRKGIVIRQECLDNPLADGCLD